MAKRARGGGSWLCEVAQAVIADPLLVAPALLVIVLALLGAYAAWKFM